MAETLYTVEFHYENIEKYSLLNKRSLKDVLEETFMIGYNKCCEIFNDHIEDINSDWEKTGKPSSFGEYLEDVNPEYVNFIRDALHQRFINLNTDLFVNYRCPLEFYIDDQCCISARFRLYPDVRMYFTMREKK